MTTVKSELGFSKVDGQHGDVFYGSPLALVGVFVEVVRARFRGANATGLPWRWKDDPTPDEGEENTEDAPRTLYIESQLNADPEARDMLPAVYVDKGDTRPLKLMVNNFAGVRLQDRTEGFYALTVVPITVMCLSNARAESANIADHVWFHLTACQRLIRSTFNIHEIGPIVLGQTQVYRRSEGKGDTWMTPVQFETQVAFRWITRPIAPLMQEIAMTLEARGQGDAHLGAVTTATHSARRK